MSILSKFKILGVANSVFSILLPILLIQPIRIGYSKSVNDMRNRWIHCSLVGANI